MNMSSFLQEWMRTHYFYLENIYFKQFSNLCSILYLNKEHIYKTDWSFLIYIKTYHVLPLSEYYVCPKFRSQLFFGPEAFFDCGKQYMECACRHTHTQHETFVASFQRI
jgi:hypothetical protein